ATLRAVQCAQAVQAELADFEAAEAAAATGPGETRPIDAGEPAAAGSPAGSPLRLSLRVAVASGLVSVLHLGGVFRRWEFLLAGRAEARDGAVRQPARPAPRHADRPGAGADAGAPIGALPLRGEHQQAQR